MNKTNTPGNSGTKLYDTLKTLCLGLRFRATEGVINQVPNSLILIAMSRLVGPDQNQHDT